MKHIWTIAALTTLILSPACTDYATFVTATNIGISADTTTQDVNIGYTRAELFHGPGYPTEGAAPSAVGYISSDLSPFSPNIKQLYATGTAAELVTQYQPPEVTKETSDTLKGQRRPFFFGTGTNFGLKVGFAGDVPSSVRVGFNREELSIIPMQRADPLSGEADKYASVLASINMSNTIGSSSGTSVRPTQFFATGAAARNLAKRGEIRGLFIQQARDQIATAVVVSADLQIKKETLATCIKADLASDPKTIAPLLIELGPATTEDAVDAVKAKYQKLSRKAC
jgi:hypothetical protein